METTWDVRREQELIEAYYPTVKASYANMVRRHLRHTCMLFRRTFSGESILQRTKTTQWVRSWQKANTLTEGTQAQELASLRRWWSWLLRRRAIDENVLDFVCIDRLVRSEEPVLMLPTGLHRAVVAYETQWAGLAKETRRLRRLSLRYFVRFVSGQLSGKTEGIEDAFCAENIMGWVRFQVVQSGIDATVRHISALGCVTKYLHDRGDLPTDPIGNLVRQYPLRGYPGIVSALAAPDMDAALLCLVGPPRFQSCLADRFEDFVKWKRLLGCKYTSAEHALTDFDRFLAGDKHASQVLTQDLLNRYAATCERLSPSTRRLRLGLVRRFCLYHKRLEPRSVVPDRYWARVRVPQFFPFIFSPEDFRRLIAATHSLGLNDSHPLRAETLRAYLRILYGTGLRPGEALRLQGDDVDLEQGILTVRETKFYKTRLVPITATLAEFLRGYARLRGAMREFPGPTHPFLCFDAGATCSLGAMESYFRKTLGEGGIASPAGRRPPRLHDLRHSFAVRRLLEWYRQGEDVQDRLFLLSTYLGHTSVTSTQVYLTATSELLEEANRRFDTYAGCLVKSEGGQPDE